MAAPASGISSQKKNRKRQLNVLNNFLFPATDFERDIIPAKI